MSFQRLEFENHPRMEKLTLSRSIVDDQIIDAKNKDRIWAYEASRSHGLIDPNQDDQPAIAMINADNYAWISTVSIWDESSPNMR